MLGEGEESSAEPRVSADGRRMDSLQTNRKANPPVSTRSDHFISIFCILNKVQISCSKELIGNSVHLALHRDGCPVPSAPSISRHMECSSGEVFLPQHTKGNQRRRELKYTLKGLWRKCHVTPRN